VISKIKSLPKKPFTKPQPSVPLAAPVRPTGPISILSKGEVLEILGVSPVTLWCMIRRGSFPAPRQFGPEGTHRAKIGWIDSEVYEAIANAPRRFPKGSIKQCG
jgi:predicted DNA-binding transcriptional regulator AlpA